MPLQDALLSGLEEKRNLRDNLRKELESQTTSFTNMEREAQALLRRATQANRKVTVGPGLTPGQLGPAPNQGWLPVNLSWTWVKEYQLCCSVPMHRASCKRHGATAQCRRQQTSSRPGARSLLRASPHIASRHRQAPPADSVSLCSHHVRPHPCHVVVLASVWPVCATITSKGSSESSMRMSVP